MKIGLMFANGAAACEPGRATELAVQAEQLRSLIGMLRAAAAREGRPVEVTAEAPRDAAEARVIRDLGVERVLAYVPARDGELGPALTRIMHRIESLLQ